ncbi:MAG: hydroxypyruvate isomerase family protein [Mariniblastus sp.]
MSDNQKSPGNETLNRRNFIQKSAIGTGVVTGALAGIAKRGTAGEANSSVGLNRKNKFNLPFAPHPRMFKASAGENVIDQIKFAHDQGFTAWEMNGLGKQSAEEQEKVGKTLADLGMKMGVFVGYGSFDRPTFARKNDTVIEEVLASIKQAVEIAKRCNAKWFTVVPGSIDQQYQSEGGEWNKYGGGRLAAGYQFANVVDLLRRCSEILEPHELTMVLEPLNWHTNHGGAFLRDSDQAFAICRAVNSPSCKILFDIYHQQISEGNLIANIDLCWSEIGYFQCGDNPGRKEPGTGEINYAKVFQHIHDRSAKEGREFIVGMEHGNSIKGKEGEQAVIDAYVKVNPS